MAVLAAGLMLLMPGLGAWSAGDAAALRGAEPAPSEVVVDRWLVAGPVALGVPALSQDGDSVALSATRLPLEARWPVAGDSLRWPAGAEGAWSRRRTSPDGVLSLAEVPRQGPEREGPAMAFALAYLSADRWQEVEVSLEGAGARRAWVDGVRLDEGPVTLEQGKHWLMVQTVRPVDQDAGRWELSARLRSKTTDASLTVTLDPRRPPSWSDLRARREIREVAVNEASGRVAVLVRETDLEEDRRASHLEVRKLSSGERVAELRPASSVLEAAWSRDGSRLAVATAGEANGEGRGLWVWNGPDGGLRRILGEEGLADLSWSRDGAWIYFTATVERRTVDPDPDDGVQRLTQLWQRWTYWPDKRHLYAVDVEAGTRVTLVGDPTYSVEAPVVSPDGRRIAFTRNVRTTERPYVRSEIWILDVSVGEAEKILRLKKQVFGGPASYAWSPDGRALAFCAGLTELPETGTGASPFETELYMTPVDDPALRHLSRGFAPAVGTGNACPELHWSSADGRVYVAAEDGARTLPARTRSAVTAGTRSSTLELLSVPGRVMGPHAFDGASLVALVEGPAEPGRLLSVDLTRASPAPEGGDREPPRPAERPGVRQLDAVSLAAGDQLRLPRFRDWGFTDSEGREIEAWYWVPPDFDPGERYPALVHYYGGTLPRKQGFDERLLWYASKGYVVFMLNPAGAPGYGHAFANRHIGDWGHPAGSDVLEGVRAFLEEHAFVDGDRIGNFGGSYGGFLTMHLLTRTDLFSAAVSRAGISNIAGYWGSGWWGFSYTEGTCPGCYPWNRRDVFVERSPLYAADRIHTPLLLVHGTDDHNVVATESEQMFTALRVLDRPVELVRFEGEGHGIDSSPSVQRTFDSLILRWFDRYLRDRPAAWSARWNSE